MSVKVVCGTTWMSFQAADFFVNSESCSLPYYT